MCFPSLAGQTLYHARHPNDNCTEEFEAYITSMDAKSGGIGIIRNLSEWPNCQQKAKRIMVSPI